MQPRLPPLHDDSPLANQRDRVKLAKKGENFAVFVSRWPTPSGHVDSPTVVLLHGLGDAACVWRDVAAGLAPRARVFAVDLRGHGDSDWSTGADYRTSIMAADVGELLEELKLSEVVLVGHSMGGAVALRVASRLPAAVLRLVIVDHGPDSDPASRIEVRRSLREAYRSYPSVDDYTDVLCARHPLASRELLHAVASETTRRSESGLIRLKYDPDVLAWRERSEAEEAHPDGETWRLLAQLDCPVLVVRGAASSILSAATAGEMVERVLTQGYFASIPMSGHSVHLDNPQATTAAIARFIS